MVQRVERACVGVGDERVGAIDRGLLAFVGVAVDDGPDDAKRLAEKLVGLRVFPDDEGRMNHSLLDAGGQLAVVSQFTLLGDCRKGRRPSYQRAAKPDVAQQLVEAVCAEARALGVEVASGRFRAHMRVELVNDGPVTLLVDTSDVF